VQNFIEDIKVFRGLEIKAKHRAGFRPIADNCGTGGDGRNTFNISTAAALIAAGAGAKIAKHGNRSATSKCGSADVLEALGVKIDASENKVWGSVIKAGFGFYFAPLYHPKFKAVAPERSELKNKTKFNILGPFLNPAHVKRQLIGVSEERMMGLFKKALFRLRYRRAMVVCGGDGFDEITLTTFTNVMGFDLKKGCLRDFRYRIDPEEFGFKICSEKDLEGGSPSFNAQIITNILDGELGPKRDACVLNGAATLWVAGVVEDLEDGVRRCIDAINSGKAKETLKKVVEITNS